MSDEFDEQFSAELMGRHVLAGVTCVSHSGEVQSQRQFHGRVVKASPKDGETLIDAEGQEHYRYRRVK